MVVIDEQDVGKSREEVLMDLIYEATGERIPLDKIWFGKPRELDKRKDLEFDPNTFMPVRVNSQYDARYSAAGSGIMYRRRDINLDVMDAEFAGIKPTGLPFKISDVLEQINRNMRYPLEATDVVDYEYTELELEQILQGGIRLQAHPECLLRIDGTLLQIDPGFLNGQPLVQNTMLDGFNEVTPV